MLGHVPVILNHSSYVMYGRPLSARAILASRRADQVRSCILSWLVRASHVLLAEPPQERRGWPRRARPRRRREGTRSHRKRGPERSRTTARNSSALRLAPPTSAPSTLSTANNSLAFDGFTEPP